MFKHKKPVANPTLQAMASNAQPITTIAGAAAAIGMAAYWLNEASKSIKGNNVTPSQQGRPAEKKNQQ